MTAASPIRPAGPVVRAVLTMQLVEEHGAASPPARTREYGGLTRAPEGSIVRLSIGAAHTFHDWDADYIVGALVDAAEIEVTGSDPHGVAETRAVLAAALARARRRTG